jgi:hypothetical protein
VGYEENRIGWRVQYLAGKYHFSRDAVLNKTTPGHLSLAHVLPTNHALLPPPSLIPTSTSSPDILHSPTTPLLEPNPLPIPSLTDVFQTWNLLARTTCSSMNFLPKPSRHYNDIEPVSLLISLNCTYKITPPSTPDLPFTHASLLDNCFLSAPLPFLHNRHYDLNKPPNSYHEAITCPDSTVWFAAMKREFDSLETRKAFE